MKLPCYIIITAVMFSAIFTYACKTNLRKPYNESEIQKPNILVILVDDLGYGDLSCNGGKDIQTPHIDKLFSKGMKFKNFYANCTNTNGLKPVDELCLNYCLKK